jgi:hypothetical protein
MSFLSMLRRKGNTRRHGVRPAWREIEGSRIPTELTIVSAPSRSAAALAPPEPATLKRASIADRYFGLAASEYRA